MVVAVCDYRDRVREADGRISSSSERKNVPLGGSYELVTTLESRRGTDGDDIRDFEMAKRSNRILFRPHEVSKEVIQIVPFDYRQSFVLGEPGTMQILLDADIRGADLFSLFDPRQDLVTYNHKYDLGELKTLAYAEANERELDVLTALSEMPETIKMFADIAKALVKPRKTALEFWKLYQKEMRKSKGAVGVKAVDHLSSAWLQYRYGIMPVYYLYRDLKEQLDRDVKIFQASRKKDVVKLESGIQETLSLPGGWNGGPAARANYAISGEHKLEFLLRRIYTMEQLQGKRYGVSIPATMWELTTLSFVVDWAIQFGDLITALTPTCAEAEASAAITRVQYGIDCEIIGYVPRDATEVLTGNTGRFARITLDSYSRSVGSGTPSFQIPVGLQMNLKRTLDGFALSWPKIRQALTKR